MNETGPAGDAPGEAPDARIVLEVDALRAGIAPGAFYVVLIAVMAAIGGRSGDDPGGALWILSLWSALLLAYTLAGYGAGRARPSMPLAHGILTGFATSVVWLVARGVVAATRDIGPVISLAVLGSNLVLGATFAMFGAMIATRFAPTARRDPPPRP